MWLHDRAGMGRKRGRVKRSRDFGRAETRQTLANADLAVIALGVHRLTRLAVDDDWPPVKAARDWLTKRLGKESLTVRALECPWCVSPWIAAGIVLLALRWPKVRKSLLIPALSSAAGLLSTLDSAMGRAWPDLEPVLSPALSEWRMPTPSNDN